MTPPPRLDGYVAAVDEEFEACASLAKESEQCKSLEFSTESPTQRNTALWTTTCTARSPDPCNDL